MVMDIHLMAGVKFLLMHFSRGVIVAVMLILMRRKFGCCKMTAMKKVGIIITEINWLKVT